MLSAPPPPAAAPAPTSLEAGHVGTTGTCSGGPSGLPASEHTCDLCGKVLKSKPALIKHRVGSVNVFTLSESLI